MKNVRKYLIFFALIPVLSCSAKKNEWIRINQLGYRNYDIKVAVLLSRKTLNLNSFKVIDVNSGKVAMAFDKVVRTEALEPFISCYRLSFTKLNKSGVYRIIAGKAVSPEFRIADDVYDGTADFLLNYMRQQRCGHLGQLRQHARAPRSALELAHDRPPHRITQRTKPFNND